MRLRNIPRAAGVIENSSYVIKNGRELKGNWIKEVSEGRPVHMEVGMGKGRFITELAKRNPDIFYIGVERYSSVLLRALEKLDALEEKPENLRFLCEDAAALPEFFEKGEIEKLYLNFSDPWPKDRHAKRRLTSRQFLERWKAILPDKGTIEFKTDNKLLFDFSLVELPAAGCELKLVSYDLHSNEELMRDNVCTEYEEKFSGKGNPIYKYIAECPEETDKTR